MRLRDYSESRILARCLIEEYACKHASSGTSLSILTHSAILVPPLLATDYVAIECMKVLMPRAEIQILGFEELLDPCLEFRVYPQEFFVSVRAYIL